MTGNAAIYKFVISIQLGLTTRYYFNDKLIDRTCHSSTALILAKVNYIYYNDRLCE